MSFCEKLQKLRKENKLSQEQLADMLDVTRQSVSKWESGTTYPEMDKLIAMCKIFKCSLDDLTNDEVIDIRSENKKNNSINSIVDNFLEILNKTVKMFKTMNFKQTLGCLLTLFILGMFLLILRIPFNAVENGFYDVIVNIGRPALSNFISGLFNLILDIIYFTLYVLIFVYIYKIVYLDKYEFVKDEKKVAISGTKDEIIEEKIKILPKKETNNALFNILGSIALICIKFFVACFSIPFIFTLIFGFAFLVIAIYLMTKGVIYIGIFLGIIFILILNIEFIIVVINFLFNRKSSFKKLVWIFVTSLIGLGISSGLITTELANTEYIDDVPTEVKLSNITREVQMNGDILLDYYYNVNYVTDENLTDKVKINISYYDDFMDVFFDDNNLNIDLHVNSDGKTFKKILNLLCENLSNKKLYNYNKLTDATITVYSSSKNIETIKSNIREEEIKRNEESMQNTIDYYENIISSYNDEIDSYESNEQDNLSEIEELNDKISELEQKIENYKEQMKSIIEE